LKNYINLALILLVTVVSACKKEDSFFGFQPENNNDILNAVKVDTITLITSTVRELKQRSDNTTLALCGANNDSIFGVSRAGFNTQIRLNASNLTFNDAANVVVDSVVLSLEYAGFYGKKDASLSFNVYQITEDMKSNTDYFHNDSTTYNPVRIGSKENFVPDFDNQVTINNISLLPQLRIKLDNSFGDLIVSKSGQPELSTVENFVSFIKGLRVECTTNPSLDQGNMVYFNLLSNNSKLTIYYNNPGDTIKFAQDFVINNNCVRYNFFEQNFSTGTVNTQLNTPDVNHPYTYIQSMGGLKTKIEIPYIKNFQNIGKNIAINKAELILPLEDEGVNSTLYKNHNRLFVVAAGLGDENLSIADQFESEAYYGGFYNSTNKTYTFNIGRHINQLINNNREDLGLFILSGGSVVSANRTVLKSFSNTSNNIKLVLYYTEL
jgi:hypothetical protein